MNKEAKEEIDWTPRTYPCKRCGDGTAVTIADAPAHAARFHPNKNMVAKQAAREALSARMADPAYQQKLREAREAKSRPATED